MLWNAQVCAAARQQAEGLLRGGGGRALPDLPGAAEAFLVWALAAASERTVLWIGDGPLALERIGRDLAALAPPGAPRLLAFPGWETLPHDPADEPDTATSGARLRALAELRHSGRGAVVAASVQALMEPTLAREALEAHTLSLARGEEHDLSAMTERLQAAGYRFVPEVTLPGEAALRGGILDAWPLTTVWPVRVECAGSVVDSLRTFDPLDQRSRERLEGVVLTPAGEWRLMRGDPSRRATLFAWLPAGSLVLWSDPDRIRHYAATYETTVAEEGRASLLLPFEGVRSGVRALSPALEVFLGSPPPEPCPPGDFGCAAVEGPLSTAAGVAHPDLAETSRARFLEGLVNEARTGRTVCLYFDTAGALERFREAYPAVAGDGRIAAVVGAISAGFAAPALGLTVVAESDLYGRRIRRRRPPIERRGAAEDAGGRRVSDWSDIEPGQLVVHVEHGVGRYLGLREIVFNGQRQEVLAIEYAEGARLYVPVVQAHLLTRYVGVGKRLPALHPLGARRWEREKDAAERAVEDLAASLLETQAAREAADGFAAGPDTPWQHALEASFPFETTEDQERAIGEVKADMESRRPMDRLLCGDAGYGKTEVAVRAAFKTVVSGRQVAVLVPTTVLAQQHYETFGERMAPFPVRIEMLSRFCSRTRADAAVAGLADGTVDVVIGTHALLQPRLVFRDLGLVIIDEEQRFGVAHKERFKHIRRLVDVLTLTATPIPRTLYLSLTGARDLSTIQTPPQERLAVETIVTPGTDTVVRDAILRELSREGQVYYLHNRVMSIGRVLDRLRRLVPEARIEIAHGQMAAGVLADVMQRFAAGAFDVLLCTTIVESGLDISNANTILIDRADRFGLGELYQLRGRVGRSRHKAYAYMLLPVHAHVDPTARRRIQAIQQYSGAGAAFRLAMRDLELRGAGNLLGREQSGHITAVGFGLYCQLLRRTVARLKGEAVPPVIDTEVRLDFVSLSPAEAASEQAALIPLHYVDDERVRLNLYRRIAEAVSAEELDALRRDFRDRFGPLPGACDRLLKVAALRVLAARQGIGSVVSEGSDSVRLAPAGAPAAGRARTIALKTGRPTDRLDEVLSALGHRP